jgi:hypothetical protein
MIPHMQQVPSWYAMHFRCMDDSFGLRDSLTTSGVQKNQDLRVPGPRWDNLASSGTKKSRFDSTYMRAQDKFKDLKCNSFFVFYGRTVLWVCYKSFDQSWVGEYSDWLLSNKNKNIYITCSIVFHPYCSGRFSLVAFRILQGIQFQKLFVMRSIRLKWSSWILFSSLMVLLMYSDKYFISRA